ncbi:MAG: hypothetical protein LBV80_07875 [Deltaproteobacteria bacterium]|nr:hypothetical protein [Deltaproteobacteria bacterium]
MTASLTFQSTTFDVIDHNGQPWIQARQLGKALGYARSDAILNIYERNKDEFSLGMSSSIELMEGGTLQNIRIFSLRGCHLLAMFARTDIAKQFRVWVLDVLETLNRAKQEQPPLTSSTVTDRRPLEKLIKVWCSMSGQIHAQAWVQVNSHFNLNSVTELPTEWIPDALAFVQGKIDALPKELPKAQQMALPAPVPQAKRYALLERLQKSYAQMDAAQNSVEDASREFSAASNELQHVCYHELPRKEGEALHTLVAMLGQMNFMHYTLWINLSRMMNTTRYLIGTEK